MKHQKEPEAIRELHRIREAMLDEEEGTGSETFLADLNRLGEEFARKHRLRRAKAAPAGRPAKARAARLALPALAD
jgi:hypothetical protein